MAALPYMPLYVADYMADAAHLSTLEHGAYLLLIMTYWQRGKALPADDAKLARIARMTPSEWDEIRDTMAEFFTDDGETWSHRRIERELDAVRAKSEQARNAGKASARRRNGGGSADVEPEPNARSTPVQRPCNHTDTDTDTEEDIPPVSPKGDEAPKPKVAKRATAIPEDWTPNDRDKRFASERGFDSGTIALQTEKFRNHWQAKGVTRKDWSATWRNWILNDLEWHGPPDKRGKPATSSGATDWFDREFGTTAAVEPMGVLN